MEKIKMKNQFFKCSKCGSIVYAVVGTTNGLTCCGVPMKKMNPNSTDAANEKHVPHIEGNKISVGSVIHPMTPEHHISFIAINNKDSMYFKFLNPNEAPVINYNLKGDEIVYEYCNLHGL